jgi:uncharacterized protein (TIGR03000 family)
MYTAVLMMTLVTSGEVSDFGRRNNCGGGCYGGCVGSCGGGCRGGLFGGGGLLGRRNHGCHGGGYGGCNGGCYGGYGGGVYAGCGGGYAGCGGMVPMHQPMMHHPMPAHGCHGGMGHGVVIGGGCTGGMGHHPHHPGGGCTGGMGHHHHPHGGGIIIVVPKDDKKKDDKKKGDKKKDDKDDDDDVSVSTTDAPAQVVVSLPADATLKIEGAATTSTGSERTFVTPALSQGGKYTWTLEAQVMQDGKPVSVTRTVSLVPGETHRVTLTMPTTSVAQR